MADRGPNTGKLRLKIISFLNQHGMTFPKSGNGVKDIHIYPIICERLGIEFPGESKQWVDVQIAEKLAGTDRSIYSSAAWYRLRYDALKRSRGCCDLCGNRDHLQVDHIKPRSKFPQLALEISNLQVLCAACNVGKGNRDQTDFRNVVPFRRTA